MITTAPRLAASLTGHTSKNDTRVAFAKSVRSAMELSYFPAGGKLVKCGPRDSFCTANFNELKLIGVHHPVHRVARHTHELGRLRNCGQTLGRSFRYLLQVPNPTVARCCHELSRDLCGQVRDVELKLFRFDDPRNDAFDNSL